MNLLLRVSLIPVLTVVALAGLATPAAADDRSPIVVTFKDGHRQTFVMGQIASIDFKTPAIVVYRDGRREKITGEIAKIEFDPSGLEPRMPTRAHFIGKWEVGDGGGHKFFITLEENGDARKTTGDPHGTWTLVDGEAHISWKDGWHDAIRKVGSRHEKVAFEPGKSFDDSPNNVTPARNTQPRPI